MYSLAFARYPVIITSYQTQTERDRKMKLFECKVLSASGNEIKVYFENGKVVAEGAGKKVEVISTNEYEKTMTIRKDDKEGIINLERGAAHVETMVNSLAKTGRELFMFESVDEAFAAYNVKGGKFGVCFESVDTATDRIDCAYKYSA